MLARVAAVLSLVLCLGASAVAAERGEQTVVPQLPNTPWSASVKALLADFAAKGAQPPKPAAADPAPAQMRMTSATLAYRMWTETTAALRALPALVDAPRLWEQRVVVSGGSKDAALGFWIVTLVGLIAAPLIGRGMRKVTAHRLAAVNAAEFAGRFRPVALRLISAILGLSVFAAVFWASLLAASAGNHMLELTADRVVLAALQWRLAIVAIIIVIAADRPDLRLFAIDDAGARRCDRWIAGYATLSPFYLLLIWVIEHIGYPQAVVFGAAFSLGAGVTGYKIVMLWAIRRPIGHAILAATGGRAGPLRQAIAASWHWFFIALSLAILGAAWVGFSFGRGSATAGAAAATQAIIVGLSLVWFGSQKLVGNICHGVVGDDATTLRRQRLHRALAQLIDALLCILGAAWLAETWGIEVLDPPPGSLGRMVLRPVLFAAATVVGAWVLWTVASAIIDENMPHAAAPGDEDGPGAGAATRLGTLLPLVRNTTLIGLGAIALVTALSTLGLDIGPLVAGLGIVGIAVGFGAQSLVRDIISGIFFLMEDAFRVGEYIDTGHWRGTVEGMSLRSVKLRHQNGQMHTIPFGQVQAVTNYSRDWSVVKFNLHLDPAVEIETVRKTIKRVGEELLQDEEIGAEFIQPLKMQGVVDVLQTTLVVRCKFTAAPGRPTYLQRKALARLIEAFAAQGIHFASSNVTLNLGSVAAVG
jgi:moderate conductance mechanosensitive channel